MSETPSPAAREPKKPAEAPKAEGHDHSGEHGHAADHGPNGHDHAHSDNPFLAHHFDTPQQQFDAGKLGIWLFLVTEVLFFAGLFCAYTVYRAQHPDVFVYAHYHLDTTMGAVNTCVLLVSSLTAAWAVRAAQMADKRTLIINILITIGCAFGFLGVKYKEYSHKVHEGTLWGHYFKPEHELWELETFRTKHPEAAELAERLAAISGEPKEGKAGEKAEASPAPAAAPTAPTPAASAAPTESAAPADSAMAAASAAPASAAQPAAVHKPASPAQSAAVHKPASPAQSAAVHKPAGSVAGAPTGSAQPTAENSAAAAMASAEKPAAVASAPGAASGTAVPAGAPAAESAQAAAAHAGPPADTALSKTQLFQAELAKASPEALEPLVAAGLIDKNLLAATSIHRPFDAHVFFSIYFFMTGLHGIHVIGGIIVWIWMLTKAMKGQFGPNYFGPIDFAALYWHLVDLIWIYLFPLLYLIH